MGGGDAISVQEVRRKTNRGRKEEGGEAVRTGVDVGGGDDQAERRRRVGALCTVAVAGVFSASCCRGGGDGEQGDFGPQGRFSLFWWLDLWETVNDALWGFCEGLGRVHVT
jgi:hypothetical protein